MKPALLCSAIALSLSTIATPLHGQADSLAAFRAQLTSDNPKTKTDALQQLAAHGPAVRSDAPAIEKLMKDPDRQVRFTAAYALPQILGTEQAAKTFERITRESSSADERSAALVGFQKCGSLGLSAVARAIKSRDESIQHEALVTAAIIDTQGTLFNDVLPLLLENSESAKFFARRYVLADGIRKFFVEYARWPSDFVELEAFVRAKNPLITLAPLTKNGQIRFEPDTDGTLKVRAYSPQPDGTFKTNRYTTIEKPQKK